MDTFERPIIEIPAGEPPSELLVEDLHVGDGAEANPGSLVNVDYVGAAWSNGKEFDASWNRGDTLSFGLGASQVIEGWDQGVQGMRIGGRRRLTIPPHLGYGAREPAARSGRTRHSSSWSTSARSADLAQVHSGIG